LAVAAQMVGADEEGYGVEQEGFGGESWWQKGCELLDIVLEWSILDCMYWSFVIWVKYISIGIVLHCGLFLEALGTIFQNRSSTEAIFFLILEPTLVSLLLLNR